MQYLVHIDILNCQDNLREELMMEEELKTFENSAKSAILPSDISS